MPKEPDPVKKPAVLVLGARSEIGTRLLQKLGLKSYQIIPTSRTPEKAAGGQFKWLAGDPVNGRPEFLEALKKRLHGRPLAAVINLLGAWMQGEPEKVLVQTSKWLAEALQPLASADASAVYVSGTAVYGDRPGEVLAEDASVDPVSQMGRWLVAGESIWRDHPGWSAKIIRFPHLYGRTDDPVLNLMASGSFFVPGAGHNLTPHLHWDDAAEAVAAAVEAPAGTYHWADRRKTTLRQWCDMITESRGLDPLPAYTLQEALSQQVATVLGPHMKNPDLVGELFAVMSAHIELDTRQTATELALTLEYPDSMQTLKRLLDSL